MDTSPPNPPVVAPLLSPARAATRQKLIAAAIDLATEGGYEAVTVRTVAARAEVSVPTAYQHASSKDQLLVEALLELGGRSTAGVQQRRPAGDSPADRVSDVFRRIMAQVADKPLLYQAMYRAFVAWGPALPEGIGFGPERAAWIGAALRAGDTQGHSEESLDEAASILSCMFLGAMVSVTTGRPIPEVLEVLITTVHRLLPSSGNQPK
ncbi:TetR/AcrR family transcriptional regulator [Enemella sp. A6]|uniref:TetR/AcrR family transcriptional regulator n=1 Tax=Enemella sp. A6 TaxID=3440152 RepID=UPI003EBC7C55